MSQVLSPRTQRLPGESTQRALRTHRFFSQVRLAADPWWQIQHHRHICSGRLSLDGFVVYFVYSFYLFILFCFLSNSSSLQEGLGRHWGISKNFSSQVFNANRFNVIIIVIITTIKIKYCVDFILSELNYLIFPMSKVEISHI